MSLHAQQLQLPTCSSRTSRSNRHAVTAVPGLWPHARHPATTFSLSQAGCAAQHRPEARLQPCRVASLDRPAVKPAEEGQQPAAGADSDSASTTGRMKQQSQAYLEQYVLPPAREVLQQVRPCLCSICGIHGHHAFTHSLPHAFVHVLNSRAGHSNHHQLS